VLVSAKENDSKEAQSRRKERPKSLDAEVIRFKNGAEQWIALVGHIEGIPYEIFTGLIDEDTRSIPKSVTMGYIVKEKDESANTRYDFHYIDKYGYRNIIGGVSHMFNKEFWNYAKLISGVLRNGMPIVDVVNLVSGLQLDSEAINTWKNGVERTLKRYIPDGTKDDSGKKCEKCGSLNLVYQEGCLTCMACGNSKCG
jgi:ribonucleoside-diphosphate reductase alpha chain